MLPRHNVRYAFGKSCCVSDVAIEYAMSACENRGLDN